MLQSNQNVRGEEGVEGAVEGGQGPGKGHAGEVKIVVNDLIGLHVHEGLESVTLTGKLARKEI